MNSRLCLLALALCIATASAFDAGYHWDATRNAADLLGYSADAGDAFGLATVMVDSSLHHVKDSDKIDGIESLDAGDLDDHDSVNTFFLRLIHNAETRLKENKDDDEKRIAVIGATLNAVQNFYSHSNWNEKHPTTNCAECFNHSTWRSTHISHSVFTGSIREGTQLSVYGDSRTDVCAAGEALNKDHVYRPGFEDAYTSAVISSTEVLYHLRAHVEDLKTYKIANRVAFDKTFDQHYRLALYHQDLDFSLNSFGKPQNDGFWKGPGSGFTATYNAAKLKFSSSDIFWTAVVDEAPEVAKIPDTKLSAITIESFKTILGASADNVRVLTIRTNRVEGVNVASGYADYVLTVTFRKSSNTNDKFVVTEGMQIDRSALHPLWTSVYVTTEAEVFAEVALIDEDKHEIGGAFESGVASGVESDINSLPSELKSIATDINLTKVAGDDKAGAVLGTCRTEDTKAGCTCLEDQYSSKNKCVLVSYLIEDGHFFQARDVQGDDSTDSASVVFQTKSRVLYSCPKGKDTEDECTDYYHRFGAAHYSTPFICTEEGAARAAARVQSSIGGLIAGAVLAVAAVIAGVVMLWRYFYMKEHPCCCGCELESQREAQRESMRRGFLNPSRDTDYKTRRNSLPKPGSHY
eukprot:GFYU01019965.1.p1 GENE.GFYU01019965.1~~GFYU01019965.1.p1  ORF type:complete len:636 (-),score=224.50 GFYU01019965.1:194-2101(-)